MPESTMLRFVQILPQVSPKGEFILKDLPGSGKRIDVLCRDLAACFEWGPVSWSKSHLEMIAVIGNSKILTFSDPQDKLPQGEVGWASVIKDSLRENPPIYVDVSEGTLDDLIIRLMQIKESNLWVLDEQGTSLYAGPKIQAIAQNSFILGDHRGFDSEAEGIISEFDIQRISLGGKSYLSSHCLAAIISEFERMVR